VATESIAVLKIEGLEGRKLLAAELFFADCLERKAVANG